MKLFLLVLVFSFFSFGWHNFSVNAQTPVTSTGTIRNSSADKKNPNSLDISKIDFKNFTYPDFGDGGFDKTFTLKNGKQSGESSYRLRKTYYFDITGDEQDEAVTHILVEGCKLGCDWSNLFYIHTAEKNQPKLLWKIAIGGNVLGGLKSIHFKLGEIVIETFGSCSNENGIIKPDVDIKKNPGLLTRNYTRFVFKLSENGYTQTGRDVLPMPETNVSDYRPKISFSND